MSNGSFDPPVTFAEHICAAIYRALVADFGSVHMGVERLDSMSDPQSALLFFKPPEGPDGGWRYATVYGQSVSLAVNEAICSWAQDHTEPETKTKDTEEMSNITLANCSLAQLEGVRVRGLHPTRERRELIFAAGALGNERLKSELGSMELSTFYDGMLAAGLIDSNPYWPRYPLGPKQRGWR